MKKFFYVFILTMLFPIMGFSQKGFVNRGIILDGDTISDITLPEFYVVKNKIFKSKRDEERYNRLVRYVKIVYPYAKLAGEKLDQYNTLMLNSSELNKKILMKRAETEFRAEYEDQLRNLTIGQGKILVKLLDRETNNTSYELLKELRGSFTAVVWQGIGRVFGYNLKTKYDPTGEDKDIERIIKLIDIGAI